MSENMISLKRKADFMEILTQFHKHEPWSEEERSIPITQSFWFTQLILLIIKFSQEGANKQELAYEIFGTMCNYINRSYSIEPAKDLLAALEQNSIRIGAPQDSGFLIGLIGNITQTGYDRCGTNTVVPFLAWFHACDISLQEIRETLIMEYRRQFQEAKDLEADTIIQAKKNAAQKKRKNKKIAAKASKVKKLEKKTDKS